MKHDKNYGDKKSTRYHLIKALINTYQLGSGLNFTTSKSFANPPVCIFIPSDPDELVDQLKLLYLEKAGDNDNPQLNEQIIAIVDKLLEYECIATNQHKNILSTFTKTDHFED